MRILSPLAIVFPVCFLVSTNVFGQVNSWTSNLTGNWHDLTWSLGSRPASSQAVYITNASSKAVILNSTTRDSFASSLVVSNLTISAPVGGTNTILLNFIGTTTPVQISNNVFVSSRSVLLNLSSLLRVGTSTNGGVYIDGGAINQDGGSNILQHICYVGYSSAGAYNLTNGTLVTDFLSVGDSQSGTFKQLGGTTICRGGMSVGSIGGFSSVDLLGGNAIASSVSVAKVGFFNQHGGNLYITNDLLVTQDATFYLDGSTLTNDSVTIGYGDNGSFSQFGGIHRTRYLSVSGDSYGAHGSYDLSGGQLIAGDVSLGDAGLFYQSGGTNNVVGNLNVAGGYLLSGGIVTSSNSSLSASYYTAEIQHSAGTHVVSNRLTIAGSFDYLATYRLNSGTLNAREIELLTRGHLVHTNGTLINSNKFIFSGGRLFSDNVTEDLGTLVVSASSSIDLDVSATTMRFASSSGISWTSGALLTLNGWRGSPSGGGLHKVFVGTNSSGLTTTQVGQIQLTHSVSAGLNYAAVGPEHAWLRDKKRVDYTYATDDQALNAFNKLARLEGIIPALESSHAIAACIEQAPKLSSDKIVIVNLSGRGDKDVAQVAAKIKL